MRKLYPFICIFLADNALRFKSLFLLSTYMRKYLYLAYDLACICAALVAALFLRHGFPLIQEGQPEDLYILLSVTFGCALIIFSLMHTNTSMWRYTSTSELASIMIAVALVILVSNSGLFLLSRLEMMPRSVPPMHWAIAVGLMCGTRICVRRWFTSGQNRDQEKPAIQHVIVIGVCHTAELYLQFIKRIVQNPVVVEGFLDSDRNLKNWMFQKYEVLGVPEDLPKILDRFNVHGIHITQVILAQRLDTLSKPAKKILKELAKAGVIELVHFSKHIGSQLQPKDKRDSNDFYQNVTAISHQAYKKPTGIYPYIKRLFDIVFACALLILLFPIMLFTALLVIMDVGFPILFWHQRPGQYGRPFRLYKFRTMRPSGRKTGEDRLAHKSGDKARTSKIGKYIRSLRLDELPQLFHIITGTMSFVGPRPLLPDDQPKGGEIRLSVRPGATGWAQIHGGDALSPKEKLVLDTWYIENMSFWLDMRIMLRTLCVVLNEDAKQRERHGQI